MMLYDRVWGRGCRKDRRKVSGHKFNQQNTDIYAWNRLCRAADNIDNVSTWCSIRTIENSDEAERVEELVILCDAIRQKAQHLQTRLNVKLKEFAGGGGI